MTPLKLGRRQAVSTGMTTSGVIEHFDVVEDIAAGILPGGIGFTADALTFEQLEETLCDSVVMAVAPSAHAGLQFVALEEVLPLSASELAALVGMNQHRLAGPAPPNGHQQRIQSQLGVDAVAHGPTHHLTREQVNNHRQVQPAFVSADVGNVRHPRLVGHFHRELLLQHIGRERPQLVCYRPSTTCQFDSAVPSFFSSANLVAMVGLPRVSFLTVRSSALSLARRRLLADL